MTIVCRREACPHFAQREHPMTLLDEYPNAWHFVCRTCGAGRMVTKDKVGGTLGAGRAANGCRPVVGRGC